MGMLWPGVSVRIEDLLSQIIRKKQSLRVLDGRPSQVSHLMLLSEPQPQTLFWFTRQVTGDRGDLSSTDVSGPVLSLILWCGGTDNKSDFDSVECHCRLQRQ